MHLLFLDSYLQEMDIALFHDHQSPESYISVQVSTYVYLYPKSQERFFWQLIFAYLFFRLRIFVLINATFLVLAGSYFEKFLSYSALLFLLKMNKMAKLKDCYKSRFQISLL